MLSLQFEDEQGFFPVLYHESNRMIEMNFPIEISYFKGKNQKLRYSSVSQTSLNDWVGEKSWNFNGIQFFLSDTWKVTGRDQVVLNRKMKAITNDEIKLSGEGIQLEVKLTQPTEHSEKWRFFSPATLYTNENEDTFKKRVYMDDRLTYPLVLAYHSPTKSYVSLSQVNLSKFVEKPVRKERESCFLQKTDLCSIGYSRNHDHIYYHAYWPYLEGEQSVALNSALTPVSVFYPLEEDFIMNFSCEINIKKAEHFADAVFSAFKHAADVNPPEVVDLPFTLTDSMHFRAESLKKCYRELSEEIAGFFFHFDPRKGYSSEPSGFSSSFNTIPHESYTSILEYGFTGRQLNGAYILAKQYGEEWIHKGKKVVDFFINHCCLPSGWMYSLYNLTADKPFHSFGDSTAPKLHYISHGDISGNYLRTMVEPALDILLNYQLYKSKGKMEEGWLEACKRFGDFLIKAQMNDGSWYRAYQQDGTPLKSGPGFGFDDFSSKSATAIPIIFLLSLWKEDQENGEMYFRAAKKAADFVMATYVESDHYQGGTLDNPNVVDKEAAQYTMAALFHLYQCTQEQKYLEGADRAAKIFITWNYIWNAPNLPNTVLQKLNFKTVGLGGINSIWGGGVVDIYSLFHIRELYLLGKTVDELFYCKMAGWIAAGTQQILSYPDELMDFQDIGMQPEGFGVCNQGIDEGMIAKGDIWGTLGWIYSAGLFGLENYLKELDFHSSGKISIMKES